MDISKAFKEERVMKALTGIGIEQFYKTAQSLKLAMWSDAVRKNIHASINGTQRGALYHINLKLFFILFYLRFHPTNQLAAFLFGMSTAQVKYWVRKILPPLCRILSHNLQPAQQQIKSLEALILEVPEIKELLSVAHLVQRTDLNNNEQHTI